MFCLFLVHPESEEPIPLQALAEAGKNSHHKRMIGIFVTVPILCQIAVKYERELEMCILTFSRIHNKEVSHSSPFSTVNTGCISNF